MASRSTARADAAAGVVPPISLRGRIRIAVRLSGMILLLLPCLAAHGLWSLVRAPSPWPRVFLRGLGWIAGARVTRHGRAARRDVVFIANHVSWIDILVIAGQTGCAFVAKAEIAASPIVGWLAGLNRTVYVSREHRAGIADQIDRLRDAMATTWSVTIFPEGTTNDGVSLLPFKSSLLKILEPAPPGVVVQPILLDYGIHIGPEIAWLGLESGRDNALRVMARSGSFPVTVDFLDTFDPVDVAGRKAIAAEARSRIALAMAAIRGVATPDFAGHDAWAERRHESGSGSGTASL